MKLDYYQGTPGTYAGFDRFGRVVDQYWRDYDTPADVDRFKYGYDFASNRTWREDVVAAAQTTPVHRDEFYSYDGLHRLKTADRGKLTGTFPNYTGVTSKNFAQDWTLDQLGNWPTFKQDDDGNGTWELDQDREHNEVNELTEFTTTSWIDPAYDDAGNMTTMPQPKDPTDDYVATYDAWNRLVKLEDGTTTASTYEYDGQNHRIVCDETGAGGDKRHFYYNDRWQVVEERVETMGSENSIALARYVWHPYYVDALAVRYYDANTDGSGIVRHWYLQDANVNVTSVVNDSAAVLERYSYTPYGEVTFLNPDFSLKAGQFSAIGNNYLYTGRERDPKSGLQINRERYYHAALGRWLTRDPIGYDGSEWNLYEYVDGKSIDNTDPSGLDCPGCDGIPDTSVTETKCTLACCAIHDRCIDVHNCTSKSWAGTFVLNSSGCLSWLKPFFPCPQCHEDAVKCFAKCALQASIPIAVKPIGLPPDEAKLNYYCARENRFITICKPNPKRQCDYPTRAAADKACCD